LITKKIIDQIEGEASIYFDMRDEVVDFATISFPHFRGIESILKGKNALDALLITPRVCGICGHAHLKATVRAIEDAYKNSGHEIVISQKAQKIREFTLVMEMMQNHFKWIYFTIIPEIAKLTLSDRVQTPLKAAFVSSLASKAIAIFAGQWPHSSYMIAGGVTCDPTYVDIIKAESYIDEIITFFEKESLGIELDKFLAFDSCREFYRLDSDISYIEENLIRRDMHKNGFGYDRFVIIGDHSFTKPSKLIKTRPFGIDAKHVSTTNSYSPYETTYAKNALYRDNFYEVGPLSRTMTINIPIIKNIHRRYKDSAYSRVLARVVELGYLLEKSKSLINLLDISEESYIEPPHISNISAEGIGVVEAPRGSLIHRVSVKDGIIEQYNIVTPTQFNIGSSSKSNPTPAQKAMIGVSREEALFIFRTFDVCSVCTTH